MENKHNKPLGVGSHVAAAFFSVFLFLFAIVLMIVLTVRGSFNEDAVTRIVEDIDIAAVVQMVNIETDTHGEEVSLAEFIAREVEVAGIAPEYFTEENIENLLELLPVDDFFGDILARYAQGILHGDGDVYISHAEVLAFIEENEQIIYEETGFLLTEENLQQVEEVLVDMNISEVTRLDNIVADAGMELSQISRALSPMVIVILVLIVLAFALIVFFVCRCRLRAACMYDGVSLCLAGGLFTAVLYYVERFALGALPASIDAGLVEAIMSGVQSAGLPAGLAAIGTGLVLIIISVIIQIKRKAPPTPQEQTP